MSKENLEQFMNQVTASEELQAKIGEEIDIEAMIALGAENGFEFNAEDLEGATKLSVEELNGVGGGAVRIKGVDLVIRPTTASAGYDSHKLTLVGRTEGVSSRPSIYSFGITGPFTLDGKGTDS